MGRVRISVLGAVRAWRDGGELPLGPPQQRCVLVLLVTAGGVPVPDWALVESVWGARAPASAANMLQTYVMRLRRLLDPDRVARAASARLPRVAGGYALRLPPADVDLWRFRALLTAARAARSAGDPPRVVDLLTHALRLFHGPPAADLPALADEPRLRTVVNEQVTAAGWLAEAAVACNRADDALAPLTELAGVRPLDEALHAHLIRVLHAAGRRSDAVATYWRVCTGLRQRLGLDPGPELADAYRALLGGRPTVTPH